MKSDLQVPRLLWSVLTLLVAGGSSLLGGASDPVPTISQERWLRTAHAQVLISAYPSLRISALSEPGRPTLLRGREEGFQSNVRFIALEQVDGGQTYLPFDQPAQWISHDERSAVLEISTKEGGRSFKLTVSLALSEKNGALDVRCSLLPEQPSSKPLALWAIASLAPRGWIMTTLSRGFERQQMIPGHLVTYWKTPLNAPSLHLEDDILAVDLSHWQQDLKYGTRSNAGWIAAIDPEQKTMLVASFPYEATAAYPDGNCNSTIYLGLHPLGGKYAEMEWLGPWTKIRAGSELTWSFSLESRPYHRGEMNPSLHHLKDSVLVPERKNPTQATSTTPGLWTLGTQSPQARDYFGRVTQWFAPGDNGEVLLASAPFWKNAPVWSEKDASFLWDKDTFIETNPDALLPWSNEARSWQMDFSVTKSDTSSKRILFQDGDSQSGICLFLELDQVTAAAWHANSQRILTAKLSAPVPLDTRCTVRLEWSECEKTMHLKVNGHSRLHTAVSFAIKPASAHLVIGRPGALPSDPLLSDLHPFIGKIFETTISHPSLP